MATKGKLATITEAGKVDSGAINCEQNGANRHFLQRSQNLTHSAHILQ